MTKNIAIVLTTLTLDGKVSKKLLKVAIEKQLALTFNVPGRKGTSSEVKVTKVRVNRIDAQ